MAWLLLLGAGLLEIVWAIAIKYTGGFTRFWPSAIGITAAVVSFVMLSMALKQLPVGPGVELLGRFNSALTMRVGDDHAGIDREAFAADQAFGHAAPHAGLEKLTQVQMHLLAQPSLRRMPKQ